jgi:hypothetical protein
MSDVHTGAISALFGSWGHTGVSRGIGEFQARRRREGYSHCRPKVSTASGLVNSWHSADQLCRGSSSWNSARSASTRQRRWRCRFRPATTRMRFSPSLPTREAITFQPAGRQVGAPLRLFSLSNCRSLPAVLAADVVTSAIACEENIVKIEADAVARFADNAIRSLLVAS